MAESELVEGDWKERFVFKMVKLEDYSKVLAHLRKVFYREAPFCKLSKFTEVDFDQMDKLVVYYLNQNDNLSFYVEEKSTGKVAGVRISYKSTKDTKIPEVTFTEKIMKVIGLLETVNQQCNIFDKFGVNYYAEFFMASVDPEFQREGIATEMYKRSIKLLRSKGYPLCKSVFTSPYARSAVSKLGFEEISRFYFLDLKNEQGDPIVPDAEPDMFGASMALKLF